MIPSQIPVDQPTDAVADLTLTRASADPLFLTTPRVSTFFGTQGLTNASGFFFERDERLYLVTSRHVLIDKATQHAPDRLEIELHVDANDLTRSVRFSILLYEDGKAAWRQGRDAGGDIDVAVLEVDRSRLPASAVIHAFTPAHLVKTFAEVPVDRKSVV